MSYKHNALFNHVGTEAVFYRLKSEYDSATLDTEVTRTPYKVRVTQERAVVDATLGFEVQPTDVIFRVPKDAFPFEPKAGDQILGGGRLYTILELQRGNVSFVCICRGEVTE